VLGSLPPKRGARSKQMPAIMSRVGTGFRPASSSRLSAASSVSAFPFLFLDLDKTMLAAQA